MIVGAKESETVGKADLVFDFSCRAIGHVEETTRYGFRVAGTPFHDV
jgi:hypothetical protein